MAWRFVAASFLSAVLVFSVQPLAGRMILPSFGGSAAVWTTSVLFFQLMLLAGYLYSHLATTSMTRRTQVRVHLGLLVVPVVSLPLAVAAEPGSGETVAVLARLVTGLAVGVGVPYFVVATSSPLLQRWFSWTDHPDADDPYFLYAAGNVGSIAGLLAYPLVIEPMLSLRAQAVAWTVGYVALVLSVVACAVVILRRPRSAVADVPVDTARPAHRPVPAGGASDREPATVVRWVWLSFLPSSLMLGVTTFLTVDLASIPLLWVLPLALYLGTFVVVFSGRGDRIVGWSAEATVPLLLAAAVSVLAAMPITVTIVVVLAAYWCLALAVHARLADARPHPSSLTRYFVWVGVGGALGGVVNGVLAPLLLPGPFEFAIVGVFAAFAAGHVLGGGSDDHRSVLLGAVTTLVVPVGICVAALFVEIPWVRWSLLVGALAIGVPLRFVGTHGTRLATGVAVVLLALPPATNYLSGGAHRSFFGSYLVDVDGELRTFSSGTTLHGVQRSDGDLTPLSYYHPDGPLGQWLPMDGPGHVCAVGLGAGSVAGYGRAGQQVTFIEIDPLVERLARAHFTYLSGSPADVQVRIGDGRLVVAGMPDDDCDVLVLDAFSSDSIPVHLLTREAVAEYRRVLAPGGVLLVHISNRHLDLSGVVLAGADAVDMHARVRSDPDHEDGETPSRWVAVLQDQAGFDGLDDAGWGQITAEPVNWTDDFSNILQVLTG